jgi:hypothetical protein
MIRVLFGERKVVKGRAQVNAFSELFSARHAPLAPHSYTRHSVAVSPLVRCCFTIPELV